MAFGFVKKTWKDRISEYPTRRTLTKEDGSTELVTVSRSEGTVSQEGDAFSADNMNDLETRVDDALNEVNSNLKYKKIWENPDYTVPFDNQKISLDLSDYDYVDITARITYNDDAVVTMRFIKPSNQTFSFMSGSLLLQRGYVVSNDGVEVLGSLDFNVATSAIVAQGIDRFVPVAFYGGKFTN